MPWKPLGGIRSRAGERGGWQRRQERECQGDARLGDTLPEGASGTLRLPARPGEIEKREWDRPINRLPGSVGVHVSAASESREESTEASHVSRLLLLLSAPTTINTVECHQ